MRNDRTRILVWCCLLAALLTMSGCFSDPPMPSTNPNRPDWLSVKTTQDLPDVIMERVTYRSGDLTIFGQVCRPASAGRHPVLISNHGGFQGLRDWDDLDGFCAKAAKAGWALAESSYRGEDGSDGDVEVCLGEVDDVLAMLDVMRRQDYADPDRIAMVGGSHGGCVTSRAVERGADVDVAVDIAGPADWIPLMRGAKRRVKSPSTDLVLKQFYQILITLVEKAVDGTPEQVPKRYAARSPDPKKIARWNKPFLIMQGGADVVVPVQQSCGLARKVGDFRAYRFDKQGDVVPQAPPGCEKLKWSDTPRNSEVDFDADRYLLVYDEVDHFRLDLDVGLPRVMEKDLFRFLETKLPR